MAGATIFVAGCATTNGITSIDPATIQAIQAAATIECGFLPTEIQIASLFPSAAAAAATAGTIGDLICKAVVAQVPPASRKLGAAVATTVMITLPDGTKATIVGTFVRRQSHRHR